MDTRSIGSLKVSVVGLGCNNFGWRVDAAATQQVVDAALEAGINFFDTADIYGGGQSEEFLGKAMGSRRNQIVLATKFGMKMGETMAGGAKPAYVKQALEASLRRLQTDHIDLYQLHTPDKDTPIADTVGALEELKQAGKIREFGCSNFSADQLREAPQFASVQNNYSMFHRDPETDGVLAECARRNIAFLPYFPLANGLLTGKYHKGQALPAGSRATDGFGPKVFTEENLAKVDALAEYAASKGHTLLELAVSWLLRHPQVASVIAGAKSADQIKTNASAANWKLSAEDLAEIDKRLQ